MTEKALGYSSSDWEVNMKYLFRTIIFVAMIASIPACFGQAGAMTGEISGAVTDPSGAPIPAVTVTARNTGTGYKQSVKTGDTGIYRLTLLPLGTYEVETQTRV